MNAPSPASEDRAKHGMPFREFVALIAALSAVNALGIDIMLPALGQIGFELGVTVENDQQLVILSHTIGFAVGQLFWGPIADRFGRRPVLLGAMIVYLIVSFIAALAGSFELLLLARILQGMSAASTRVLSVSIVRDCYSGRRMAKVSSLAFMVFLVVPVLAPTLGQLILLIAPWQWIFYGLGIYAMAIALWAGLRLPETLDPAARRPVNPSAIARASWLVVTNRFSLGYTLAGGIVFGALLAFVSSGPQIVNHVFGRPDLFTLCFAAIGVFMAMAALINARFVERYGMRMISHIALGFLILIGLIHLAVQLTGYQSLLLFTVFNALSFFCFGLAGANFGAMAMEPMGHIAGTAASVQGFLSTIVGAVLAYIIGRSFSGTALPLAIGWEIASLIALGLVLWVERGRLFHAPPAAAPGRP